jgi:FRG domain
MANPSDKPVESLGEFVTLVRDYRDFWGNEEDQELWFRGESKDFGVTKLRPELYRPALGKALKPIDDLLDIERDLYEEFQRVAVERCGVVSPNSEDWDWDSYFLMQHHEGPTRLLDFSDGALMALHFATRNREDDDGGDSYVYILEPYRLMDRLAALPDRKIIEDAWKSYSEKNQRCELDPDDWDTIYLPGNPESLSIQLPRPPLLLDFPLITRRFAAQRSRFVVFGTEPDWPSSHAGEPDSAVKRIAVKSCFRPLIRQQLRDCGVTESVIYPDLDGLGREMRQLWQDRKAKS